MNNGKKRAGATLKSKPILSEEQLDAASKELCDLFSREKTLSAAEERRLLSLAAAVEDYESVHHPIPDPSPAALLEHLLEAKRSNASQLAKATGVTRYAVTAILNGKRTIQPSEAKRFAKYFRVEESVFGIDANGKKGKSRTKAMVHA